VAQALGQIYVLLLLREASHVSQNTNTLHFEREADGKKTLGVAGRVYLVAHSSYSLEE